LYSDRVSENELREKIDSLSEETGVRFTPNFCYGAFGVHILIPNSAGCVRDFIGLGTKKETYHELETIQRYLCKNDPRFANDQISNCIHRDSLNHYEGKKDVSVMHESITTKKGREIKTYFCSGCYRKDLTEKEFKKSKIPITYRGLKKKVEVKN